MSSHRRRRRANRRELGAIKDRGPDFILLNVLDPNRGVLPKFITYVVTTDGLTVTGMITAEDGDEITVRKPDGTEPDDPCVVNIEELRSTGMSFMPEGWRRAINQQEMADLIAFLMRRLSSFSARRCLQRRHAPGDERRKRGRGLCWFEMPCR